MSYKCPSFGHLHDNLCNFEEAGRILNHFIGDACQVGYKIWNVSFRIDQGDIFTCNLFSVMQTDCYFSDLFKSRTPACCFDVYYGIHMKDTWKITDEDSQISSWSAFKFVLL